MKGALSAAFGAQKSDKNSNQEPAEMHFMYGKADGNAALARHLYQERYPSEDVQKTFEISVAICVLLGSLYFLLCGETTKIYNSSCRKGDYGFCAHNSFYQYMKHWVKSSCSSYNRWQWRRSNVFQSGHPHCGHLPWHKQRASAALLSPHRT